MPRKDDTDDLDGIDTRTLLERLTAALENLGNRPADEHNGELMVKLTDALARISETQLEGSKLVASETRRALRPSNEVVPNRSVFNQRGTMLPDYQKPRLKCTMLIPWLAEWESLTREEVELLNLLQPGTYPVKRPDKSLIKVNVKIDYGMDEVTPSRLLMNHETAFNNDNFKLAPPLTDMLRQILKLHPKEIALAAAEVLSDEEEEALIEAGQLTVSV